MMEFFDVNYSMLSDNRSRELFSLRNKTFKERLNWIVNSKNNMESDNYDNKNTNYLFGMFDNLIICSLRFIDVNYPNMISGTFKYYFDEIEIPKGNFVEASRLFIDKERVRTFELQHQPISLLLFLSMINYARHYGYEGIYAIVSHPMHIIFKKSGWIISAVAQGFSEKKEKIYLIYMPVDDKNQQLLLDRIDSEAPQVAHRLGAWPLLYPIRKNGPNQL